LIIMVVAFWWYARTNHPTWTESLLSKATRWPWTATWWVGGIAEMLLFAAAMFLFMPMKSRHSGTDDAMGLGCARVTAFALGAIALVLALAMIFKVRWLIHAIGLGTIFIATGLMLSLAWEGIQAQRKRIESRRGAANDQAATRIK
jgi:hypothetical protein